MDSKRELDLTTAFRVRRHETPEDWYKFLSDAPYRHLILSTPESTKHPWAKYISGKECLALNGVPGQPYRIRIGKIYALSLVSGAKSPIFLTTDPKGGKTCQGFSPVVEAGTSLVFRVTADFPIVSYYQSTQHSHWGGLLVVVGSSSDDCSEDEDDDDSGSAKTDKNTKF